MKNAKVEFAIWFMLSVALAFVVAFVEFVISIWTTFELHMNSSAAGDFAVAARSVILTDIAVYLGVPFLINAGIVYYWYVQTRRQFDPPFLSERVSHCMTLVLCVVVALILSGHLVYSAVDYWQKRAPFFEYRPNFP